MKIDSKEVMMTNHEFVNYCYKLGIPLMGVYNKDTLPPHPREGYYLINLQDDRDEYGNDLFGTHWTCFIIEGKQACYYDSFAFAPPAQVQHFLKAFRPYPIAKKQTQNPTSHICGYLCLYFFWFMMHHKKLPMVKRFDRFMDVWSDDVRDNKRLLEKYLAPL